MKYGVCKHKTKFSFKTQDADYAGRASIVLTHEIVDHVLDLILANQRISTKRITEKF